jgi:hypothetical protein
MCDWNKKLLAARMDALEASLADLRRDVTESSKRTPDPAPEPVGEFTEPWTTTTYPGGTNACDANGVRLFRVEPACLRPYARRAAACTNALAGIKNVAAVDKLVAKVRSMIELHHIQSYPARILKDLLADLDKAPDAEGGG